MDGSAHRVVPHTSVQACCSTRTIRAETMYESSGGYEIMARHYRIMIQLTLLLPLCPLCCCQLFKNASYPASLPRSIYTRHCGFGSSNLCRISSPASPPPFSLSLPLLLLLLSPTLTPHHHLSCLSPLCRGRIVSKRKKQCYDIAKKPLRKPSL